MAEKRQITIHPIGAKKVISEAPTSLETLIKSEKVENVKPLRDDVEVEGKESTIKTKRSCYFCQSKTSPSYTDLNNLKRFLTERAKILPKMRSSVCARHQRAVSKHIKYARHLALLPFVPKI